MNLKQTLFNNNKTHSAIKKVIKTKNYCLEKQKQLKQDKNIKPLQPH